MHADDDLRNVGTFRHHLTPAGIVALIIFFVVLVFAAFNPPKNAPKPSPHAAPSHNQSALDSAPAASTVP